MKNAEFPKLNCRKRRNHWFLFTESALLQRSKVVPLSTVLSTNGWKQNMHVLKINMWHKIKHIHYQVTKFKNPPDVQTWSAWFIVMPKTKKIFCFLYIHIFFTQNIFIRLRRDRSYQGKHFCSTAHNSLSSPSVDSCRFFFVPSSLVPFFCPAKT